MEETKLRYLLGDEKPTKPLLTQIKIADAMVDLMQDTDFDRIKVTDIVAHAGIVRSTFYLYFKDTVDVVEHMEEALISHMPFYSSSRQARIIATPDEPPTPDMCARLPWIQEWFEYVECFKREFSALIGPHGDKSFTYRIQAFLRSSYQLQMNDDHIRNDELRNFHVKACTELQLIMLSNWLKDGRRAELSAEELANVLNLVRVGGLYVHYLAHENDKQSQ